MHGRCRGGTRRAGENPERRFRELRDKISEGKEYLTEERETLKRNQILELKDSVKEMKNAFEGAANRADCMKERICELKDSKIEMIQVKEKRELSS